MKHAIIIKFDTTYTIYISVCVYIGRGNCPSSGGQLSGGGVVRGGDVRFPYNPTRLDRVQSKCGRRHVAPCGPWANHQAHVQGAARLAHKREPSPSSIYVKPTIHPCMEDLARLCSFNIRPATWI